MMVFVIIIVLNIGICVQVNCEVVKLFVLIRIIGEIVI